MSEIIIENLSRRRFLQGGAGLTLGFCLPVMAAAAAGKSGVTVAPAGSFEPNAFLRIGADNSVTVMSKHLEMGQGTYTGLATILADELDADIEALNDLYTAILLEYGVIDEHGNETDLDFDEDDLIDAMLARFLADHSGDDERELLYATLIDAYLAMVEEASEDM